MPQTAWCAHYAQHTRPRALLYPEGFVVRIFLSRFPEAFLADHDLAGKRILDLSCGGGRNLGLLLDLGFEVHATEISPEIVARTGALFPDVTMRVGRNGQLPYDDASFDYLLACNSCYYLDPGRSFADNLDEIARVLRPGGTFIGSIPGPDHFIFAGGELRVDGSVIVRGDRDGLRNGDRLQCARVRAQIAAHLADRFAKPRIGRLVDDAYDLVRDLFYFTAARR